MGYNPVNRVDPTGHAQQCADGDLGGGCGSDGTVGYLIDRIETKYRVVVNNDNNLWNGSKLLGIEKGMEEFSNMMEGDRFQEVFSGTTFTISSEDGDYWRSVMRAVGKDNIVIGDQRRLDEMDRGTVHELAHIWDARCDYCKSNTMMTITGSKYVDGKYFPSGQMSSDYPSADTPNGALEDWAESVTNVVLSKPVHDPWDYRRRDYVGQNMDPNYYGGVH